jgi:ribose 5-phosphate isomerase B
MDVARVYVGSDHAGFSLRKNLTERLRRQGREVVDLGPLSDAACDYPEFASIVANAVRSDPGSLGILVCATGQGMAIAAGKVRGIRAVVPATVEAARLTRFDNNANVLCIGSRLLSENDAFAIVDTWLGTGFAGGRHARRIAKVAAIETASAVVFVTESERLRLKSLGVPGRIFARDPTLFSDHRPARPVDTHMLDWVTLPYDMTARLADLAGCAHAARNLPLRQLVVLVEDEVRAPAATMARLCAGSGVHVHVLGGARASVAVSETAGKTAAANQSAAPPLPESALVGGTLVLVVAKTEPSDGWLAAEEALWSRFLAKHGGDAAQAAQHFVAVTADGTQLAGLAHARGDRKVFLDGANLPPQFGLLGFEGLLPAVLLGHDAARLLARASAMADACRIDRLEDNPGASLGVLLGAMGKHGRAKLTLLLSKSLQPLGGWIAALLADATQHGPHRMTVLLDEPLLPHYPPDRIFVQLQVTGDAPAVSAEQIEALHGAGQPYIHIAIAERQDLAAEIFRWQMAATVAALVMGSNPFAVAPQP